MTYVNPPVHELGMSVGFGSRTALTDYKIESIHRLFADELPIVQRAVAAPGPDILPVLGYAPLNADAPPPSRWWFTSTDEAFILQLQENFISVNWRRRSEIDSPSNYPGFDEVYKRFVDYTSRLKSWHEGNGSKLPDPIAAELVYDDLIRFPLLDGERMRISDVLTFWPVQERILSGWNINWVEPLSQPPTVEEGVLKFDAVVAAIGGELAGASPRPILRINWVATAATPSWAASHAFFLRAHDHIGERFAEVVTPEACATWERRPA